MISKESSALFDHIKETLLQRDPAKQLHIRDEDIRVLADAVLSPTGQGKPSALPRPILSWPGGARVICWTHTKKGDSLLGKGANKKVKVGTFVNVDRNVSACLVALEIQKNEDCTPLSERQQQAHLRDYELRRRLADNAELQPLIINVYTYHMSDKKIKTVVELAERSLGYLTREGGLMSRVSDCMKQMLFIVATLHRAELVHGDLKPDNFLEMPDKTTVKLTDFDCHREINAKEERALGTPYYMAPEIYRAIKSKQSFQCSAKIDAWSLGCSFFEMFVQNKLLKMLAASTGINLKKLEDVSLLMYHSELQNRIDDLLKIDLGIPEKQLRVIHSLLKICPTERLSVEEAYFDLELA